jgi:type II secretory pathway pseudopilin PulG
MRTDNFTGDYLRDASLPDRVAKFSRTISTEDEIKLNKMTQHNSFINKQSGSTLIVSLIILILLMLIGVSAMTTSDTQFKLTGNLQYETLAMNNAEAAANAAERWLDANAGTTPSKPAISTLQDPLTMTWDDSNSLKVANLEEQRYVIGFVVLKASPLAGLGLDCTSASNAHNFDCVNTYLVTARGKSGRGAVKIIQTYYAVPLK